MCMQAVRSCASVSCTLHCQRKYIQVLWHTYSCWWFVHKHNSNSRDKVITPWLSKSLWVFVSLHFLTVLTMKWKGDLDDGFDEQSMAWNVSRWNILQIERISESCLRLGSIYEMRNQGLLQSNGKYFSLPRLFFSSFFSSLFPFFNVG